MSLESLKQDAQNWCTEDRSALARLPLILYGIFLLWKIALRPEFFTPIDFLDLGIHELGHIVCMPFGEWIGIVGGSVAQILAPLFGIWQFLRQRDYFAAAFGLAWLGESLSNLSVYIGDARKQELPLANLFGGDPIHDWNYLLSNANKLNLDATYALRVRLLGFIAVLAFLWLGTKLLWKIARKPTT